MLAVIGSASLDALIEEVVPPKIRSQAPLALPPSRSETDVLAELKQIAGRKQGLPQLHRPGLLRHADAQRRAAQHS